MTEILKVSSLFDLFRVAAAERCMVSLRPLRIHFFSIYGVVCLEIYFSETCRNTISRLYNLRLSRMYGVRTAESDGRRVQGTTQGDRIRVIAIETLLRRWFYFYTDSEQDLIVELSSAFCAFPSRGRGVLTN